MALKVIWLDMGFEIFEIIKLTARLAKVNEMLTAFKYFQMW